MRISDWSSDVCSSDLGEGHPVDQPRQRSFDPAALDEADDIERGLLLAIILQILLDAVAQRGFADAGAADGRDRRRRHPAAAGGDPHHVARRKRSEEHTSELQSLMRISYAVFCL